jgi:FkbM family methyltransferase
MTVDWPRRFRLAAARGFWREIEVDGVVVPLGRQLTYPILVLLADGEYEREELEIVRRTLRRDDVVMELGTGLGFLASYCARSIGSDRVFTFEANRAMESQIRRTFARNGVSPSLRICMLGRETGMAELSVNPDFRGSSTVKRVHGGHVVPVPVEPFGAAMASIRPTYLIIDIEGGEADLLAHADLSGVQRICMEVHPWALGADGVRAVRARLEAAGFTVSSELSTEGVWFLEREGGPS